MLQARIRIDGREHFVPPEFDAEALMQTITNQVRTGGGFVEIMRTPDRALSVLVSPGMSLSIELVDVDDEASPDGESERTAAVQSWVDSFEML